MFKLNGKITYKDGSPVVSGDIILKDSNFKNLYQTYTNKDGEYELIVRRANYPFLLAVKDHGVKSLEYWAKNIPVNQNTRIDAVIDRLELYGLHVFTVDGGLDNLMIYCRPMSLDKFLKKESISFPDIGENPLKVLINHQEVDIIDYKKILECKTEEHSLYGLIISIEKPDNLLDEKDNFLEVKLEDRDNNYGQASIYF